jgi:hypothetical protein
VNIIDGDPYRLRSPEELDVTLYVDSELSRKSFDEGCGAVECAQVGVNSVTAAFSRLVHIMVTRGILTAQDVTEIATGIRYDDAVFVDPTAGGES